MPNHLAGATSPYLRQHADNPVNWQPWRPEAFAEAARRNVPVLLSIGYASCHWCHVMARESFQDKELADLVNTDFLAVKVDREERPDIDAIYLAATQAMTGTAGWPLTCFLTPDAEPFHCGTYYPPESRQGVPGFRQLLLAVSKAWRAKPDQVRAKASQLVTALTGSTRTGSTPIDSTILAGCAHDLSEQFDDHNGGFGEAPKFPPSMVLEFLIRHHERTGSARALEMVELTCERMARAGLFDQIGGGFARYAVDPGWMAPHFEKMLSDNALLLRVYTHLARRTGSPLAGRIAQDTAAFLVRELLTPSGGFAAALDAETDGIEGGSYLWAPNRLSAVLGSVDGSWAAELLEVDEHNHIPSLRGDPADSARWQQVRTALLGARPRPPIEDKVVTAWNGLAITALAEAGGEWIDDAARAASFILEHHVVNGRLRRASRDGIVGDAVGTLADYGSFAEGLLALCQATGQAFWLEASLAILDTALAHFSGLDGTFFDTADDAEALLYRPHNPADAAVPSGAAAIAGALLTASVLAPADSADRYGQAAEAAMTAAGDHVRRLPSLAGHWLTVAEAAAHGPIQVAVSGQQSDPVRDVLTAAARRAAPGGAVIVAGPPDAPGLPLLASRPLIAGAPAAYICRGFVCDRPVTSEAELVSALTSP